MDRAEYLVEAEAMFHRQHEFRQQVAGVLANNGHAQNVILTRQAENLDKPERRFVRNSAVEVFQTVARYLILNAALAWLQPRTVRRGQASGWVNVVHGMTE